MSFSQKTFGPNVEADGSAPVWLRLIRRGNVLHSCWAPDNDGAPGEWSYPSRRTMENMPSAEAGVYLGLAVTSHDAGMTTEARFDHFSIDPFTALPEGTAADVLPGPEGSDGHFGVREVIGNGEIHSQADAIASLQSGTGTIVDYDATVLNLRDSGGPGHALSDISFGVVAEEHRNLGSVDDLALVAKAHIDVETAGDYTFLVLSDDSFRSGPAENRAYSHCGRPVQRACGPS